VAVDEGDRGEGGGVVTDEPFVRAAAADFSMPSAAVMESGSSSRFACGRGATVGAALASAGTIRANF
jgi:flavodoxin